MSNPNGTTRRAFLRTGIGAAVGTVSPSFIPSRVLAAPGRTGANDRIRVGLIGVGVRGKYLIGNLPDAAKVTALCDCYEPRMADVLTTAGGPFAPVLAQFRERDAKGCRTYSDYRRMLDAEPLDAIVIAAPDHHHILPAMLALQAGLDVYLEKPLSLTIAEGRRLADAVARSDRVLQIGSQQRTMEVNRFACEFIRDGGLGKVSLVEVPNYAGPIEYEELREERVPGGFDWDLFCGPTPLLPHNRRLWVKEEFHVGELLWRGWDVWRSSSGHLTTNWGAHGLDMVQYSLGKDDTGPVEVRPENMSKAELAAAARAWADKSPPPGSVAGPSDSSRFRPVSMRYADGTMLRFVTGIEAAIFHGERGRLMMSRNEFETDPPGLATGGPGPEVAAKWVGEGHVARPHLENWLECIRTRRQPNAPVETGQRTATVCHLANLARELGRTLRWDPSAERFDGDDEANTLLDRPRRKGWELPVVK